MKKILAAISLSIFCLNLIQAGCGSCNVTNKKVIIPDGEFVTKINNNGSLEGLVLASCGKCNFGMKSRRCNLAITINEKAYSVKGSGIEDHGDSHAEDGFCNAIRIAKVNGKIIENTFHSNFFKIQKI